MPHSLTMNMYRSFFESLENRNLLTGTDLASDNDESQSFNVPHATVHDFTNPDSSQQDDADSSAATVMIGSLVATTAAYSAGIAVGLLGTAGSLYIKAYGHAGLSVCGTVFSLGATGFCLFGLFPLWSNPTLHTASIVAWSLASASFIGTCSLIGLLAIAQTCQQSGSDYDIV